MLIGPAVHTPMVLTPTESKPIPTTEALITPMATTPMETTPMGTTPMQTTPIGTIPIEIVPKGAIPIASFFGLLPQCADALSSPVLSAVFMDCVETPFECRACHKPSTSDPSDGTPYNQIVGRQLLPQLEF